MKDKRITDVIKEDEVQRNDILEELEQNMFNHNKRVKEYENKMRELDVLKMKYNNLERESKEYIAKLGKKINDQQGLINDFQTENQVLKKTILTYKSKENSLKSIVALLVEDFGIDQVALACGLSNDKIQEYLEKE